MFVSTLYDVVGFLNVFFVFVNLQPLFISCIFLLLLKKAFSFFCCLPLNHLKEKTHTCSTIFLYACVCNLYRLHIFLPTWRKPDRPRLGRRSLCPERGGCWGWQSPTREHEEPAAAEGGKTFYFLRNWGQNSGKNASYFLFMTAVVKKRN